MDSGGKHGRGARRDLRRGVTLIELLIGVALVGILLAASVAGYVTIARNMAISTAGEQVLEAFQEAREDAVTKNLTIELRIYDVPPQPGAAPAYCGLQVHVMNNDGTTTPMSPARWLPNGVVIDTTEAHSTLLVHDPAVATPDPHDSHLNDQTRVVHFLPAGGTDLQATQKWFITVRAASASDADHFPANWACVVLDPYTGYVTLYRP